VLVLTVVAAVGINLFEPDYNSLQTSSSVAAFQHVLDGHARAIAATGCDIVFAAGYGTLGLIALRALGTPRRLALPAVGVIVASALFDELENIVLIRNIVVERTLTDGWIAIMRGPGTLKWIGSPVFFVLLVALGRRLVQR
jgi:hypothetical protein